jgi:hypothetical protein
MNEELFFFCHCMEACCFMFNDCMNGQNKEENEEKEENEKNYQEIKEKK